MDLSVFKAIDAINVPNRKSCPQNAQTSETADHAKPLNATKMNESLRTGLLKWIGTETYTCKKKLIFDPIDRVKDVPSCGLP